VHLGVHQWREQWRVWGRNDSIPAHLAGLEDTAVRVVGTIRDPATWYASVYRYTLQIAAKHGPEWAGMLASWTGGPTDYESVLRSWVTMGEHDRRPSRREEMLYPGEGPTLYAAMLAHYYGDPIAVDGWVRMEHQAEDLARELGVDAATIRRVGRRNVGTSAGVEVCAGLVERDRAMWNGLLQERA